MNFARSLTHGARTAVRIDRAGRSCGDFFQPMPEYFMRFGIATQWFAPHEKPAIVVFDLDVEQSTTFACVIVRFERCVAD